MMSWLTPLVGAVLFVFGWVVINRLWRPDPSWYGLIILIIGLCIMLGGALVHWGF